MTSSDEEDRHDRRTDLRQPPSEHSDPPAGTAPSTLRGAFSTGPAGCEGQVFSLPGTKLHIWLTAPTTGDPRLVVEGPDGVVQLPVEA